MKKENTLSTAKKKLESRKKKKENTLSVKKKNKILTFFLKFFFYKFPPQDRNYVIFFKTKMFDLYRWPFPPTTRKENLNDLNMIKIEIRDSHLKMTRLLKKF